MSREHAGQCAAGLAVRRGRALLRAAGRCGAARFFGSGRNGAPGTRRWQYGQCSGPASNCLRQRPHVMVDTVNFVRRRTAGILNPLPNAKANVLL